MQAVTIPPIFVKSLFEGLVLQGYDPQDILRAQGLSTQILDNPKLRISTLAFAELLEAVSTLLRDEAFGLLATPQKLGSFKLLTRACFSCETVRQSLITWCKGTNLLDNNITAHTKFTFKGGYLAFKCKMREGLNNRFIIETILTTTHRLHCWLANEFILIERIDLTFPEHEYSEEYRMLFYGAPVHFNQKHNAIHFNHKTLELGCHRAKSALENMLEKPHVYLLTQPKHSKTVYIRVRMWMENLFHQGHNNPQLYQAAEYMGLTEQTLRRHLKKDNYTFQKLKDDTRRDMAIFFINKNEESIEEIAFKLGFSEASTFIRAFKKWTGLTPLAYRKP